MKNDSFIILEGETRQNNDQPIDALKSKIIEVAAEDLLDAMMYEQPVHYAKHIILRTPHMGVCNDIPKDRHGKELKGEIFHFSERYKKDILRRYQAMKERSHE